MHDVLNKIAAKKAEQREAAKVEYRQLLERQDSLSAKDQIRLEAVMDILGIDAEQVAVDAESVLRVAEHEVIAAEKQIRNEQYIAATAEADAYTASAGEKIRELNVGMASRRAAARNAQTAFQDCDVAAREAARIREANKHIF